MKDLIKFKKEFDKIIQSSKKILISTHINPDEDAACSALGVKNYIKKKFNKSSEIKITEPAGITHELLDLTSIDYVEDIANEIKNYDLIIFVDGNEFIRFTKQETIDLSNIKSICIDHHEINNLPEYTLDLILSERASCADIITEICLLEENLIDKDLALILAVGILADTGGLKFVRKESSKVLDIMDKLLHIGDLDIGRITYYQAYFASENKFEIFRTLIKNTRNIKLKNHNISLTYSYITLGEMKELGIEGTSGSSYSYQILRMIKDHPFGFIVTPRDGEFKISFRALTGVVNVQKIALEFGGGGHKSAAGATLNSNEEITDSDLAAQKVLDTIEKMDLEYKI